MLWQKLPASSVLDSQQPYSSDSLLQHNKLFPNFAAEDDFYDFTQLLSSENQEGLSWMILPLVSLRGYSKTVDWGCIFI